MYPMRRNDRGVPDPESEFRLETSPVKSCSFDSIASSMSSSCASSNKKRTGKGAIWVEFGKWRLCVGRAVARISVWNSVCCASTSCTKANAAVSDDGLARITSLRISGFSPAINIEINTGAGTLVTLFNSFSYALRYAPTVRWMLPKVVLKDSGYHLRWQHGGFEWCLKLTWLVGSKTRGEDKNESTN
nr:hypothetical protein Iba_chr12dCG4630 [Ipomoea batatas]